MNKDNLHLNGPEYNERLFRRVTAELILDEKPAEEQILSLLLDTGFKREVAAKLLHLRTHLYENSEMRQRMENDSRVQFARWLREHGELNED